jgi:hypothetical protein
MSLLFETPPKLRGPVNVYDYLDSDETDEWREPLKSRNVLEPKGGATTVGPEINPAAVLRTDSQECYRGQAQRLEPFSFSKALPLLAEEEEE